MNRTRVLISAAVFLSFLVTSVWGMSLVGTQVLRAPRVLPKPAPTVVLFCTGDSLLNFTDPSPLQTGDNGTIVFGCGMSVGGASGLTPALAISRSGTVSATFNVPANVTISLVPNPGTIPGPLSQSQCAASGVPLTSNANVTLLAGSYSYCESFQSASNVTTVTVSWYEA